MTGGEGGGCRKKYGIKLTLSFPNIDNIGNTNGIVLMKYCIAVFLINNYFYAVPFSTTPPPTTRAWNAHLSVFGTYILCNKSWIHILFSPLRHSEWVAEHHTELKTNCYGFLYLPTPPPPTNTATITTATTG